MRKIKQIKNFVSKLHTNLRPIKENYHWCQKFKVETIVGKDTKRMYNNVKFYKSFFYYDKKLKLQEIFYELKYKYNTFVDDFDKEIYDFLDTHKDIKTVNILKPCICEFVDIDGGFFCFSLEAIVSYD